jgi:hypothetical protein
MAIIINPAQYINHGRNSVLSHNFGSNKTKKPKNGAIKDELIWG